MASKIDTSGVKMEQRILAWMCLLIGVNQLGFGAIIPVLPLYADSFGVSQTAIGMTVAVYGLARLFTGLPAGRIADLLGRRSALAIGGVSSAVGNLWCAYSATFAELIAARFLAGVGAGEMNQRLLLCARDTALFGRAPYDVDGVEDEAASGAQQCLRFGHCELHRSLLAQ